MEKNGKIVENAWTDPVTGKFKPNNPGKPIGTKHRPRFIDELDEMLDEIAEGKDYTYRKALKKQILKKMIIDGDSRLLKEYWQQKDGRPSQSTTIKGDSDNPVEINIINYANNNTLPIHPEDISDTDI